MIPYHTHTPIKFLSPVVIGYSEYGATIAAVKIEKATATQKSILRQVNTFFIDLLLQNKIVHHDCRGAMISEITISSVPRIVPFLW